jgi:rhamnose transport system ATP-binding protein
MARPLLCLEGVSKSFGAVRALQKVSFELGPGEVHALVGENGAGKSTLVSIISGAETADEGKLEIAGEAQSELDPRRARQLGIACIYQHPALFPELSVAENIGFRLQRVAAGFQRIHWKLLVSEAQGLLKRIGAEVAPETPVRELSMSQQQLVEIACAVGANARIVIMDEPTASLTGHEQQLLFGIIKSLRRDGAGILYVSHRLEEIFAIADRITVLRDGRVVRTCEASALSPAPLIELMVGREVVLNEPPCELPQQFASRPPALSIHALSCLSSGVKDVTFDIAAGEILGLAGLVGAGRTELARTLFGITPATSGEILLDGLCLRISSPRIAVECGIGYVPEDRARHGIIQELPLEQNVSMSVHDRLFPGRWLRPQRERRLAADYIQRLDIRPPSPETLAAALSGGNQQKVVLARWLATQPKLLILDEPTQGVDIGAKSEIHEIIRNLAKRGLAILLISSDLPELLSLSHRTGIMRAGRLVRLLPGQTDPHQVMTWAFGSADHAS